LRDAALTAYRELCAHCQAFENGVQREERRLAHLRRVLLWLVFVMGAFAIAAPCSTTRIPLCACSWCVALC
jgi:hypothetical protein